MTKVIRFNSDMLKMMNDYRNLLIKRYSFKKDSCDLVFQFSDTEIIKMMFSDACLFESDKISGSTSKK